MAADPIEAIARRYDMGAGVNAGLRRYWGAFLRESGVLYKYADKRNEMVGNDGFMVGNNGFVKRGFIDGWSGNENQAEVTNRYTRDNGRLEPYFMGYTAGRSARTRYDNEVAPFARGTSNVGYKKSYKIGY